MPSSHSVSNEYPSWRFYQWSKDSWDALLEAISGATATIDFEQYYFADLAPGKIGGRFLEALKEKAKEGVKIRLLLDATGSWEFYRSNVPSALRALGIEVRFHETIPLKDAGRFFQSFLRNHRRLLVVDSRIALLGGTTIKEGAAAWRDTHVRVAGPVVESLKEAFESVWGTIERLNMHKTSEPKQSIDKFTVLPNGILPNHRYIPHFIHNAVRAAAKSIYITTPYFAPGFLLFHSLCLAARRGVDVRILLPGTSDHPTGDLVAQSYFDGALRAGIRIYKYKPVFLHAKTVVIDDDWGTVGSCNFDQLSFGLNYELNILSYDPKFAQELKGHFLGDIKESSEIIQAEWEKRSLYWKFMEKCSFIARPFT